MNYKKLWLKNVAKYAKKYTRWIPKFSVGNWPGIYPNNSDVCYKAQKAQSYNCVLKLNIHFVCLFNFVFCLFTKLLEFTYSSNQN